MGFLTELNDDHKAWLDAHYLEGLTVGEVARRFGVTSQAVSHTKNSPAGQRYAAALPFALRHAINLKAGNLILARLEAAGAKLPLDLLVRLYAATLPREAPGQSVGVLVAEAHRLADEYGLDDETRARLVEFAMSGGVTAPVRGKPRLIEA